MHYNKYPYAATYTMHYCINQELLSIALQVVPCIIAKSVSFLRLGMSVVLRAILASRNHMAKTGHFIFSHFFICFLAVCHCFPHSTLFGSAFSFYLFSFSECFSPVLSRVRRSCNHGWIPGGNPFKSDNPCHSRQH